MLSMLKHFNIAEQLSKKGMCQKLKTCFSYILRKLSHNDNHLYSFPTDLRSYIKTRVLYTYVN